MGMTYQELGIFGRLRKQDCAGPFTMFCRLVHMWDKCTSKEVTNHQSLSLQNVSTFLNL